MEGRRTAKRKGKGNRERRELEGEIERDGRTKRECKVEEN